MNTPTIILTISLCMLLLVVPRQYFLFPFIMAACFVPINQRMIILNIDFTILRILVLVGLLRLTIRCETRTIQWNQFDKLFLSWIVVGSLIYFVQQRNSSAIVLKLGVMYDSIGMYWLFRQAVQQWEDVFLAIKLFAVFAIITAPLIALEKFQETSFFSLFGPTTGEFHRGRYRAAGSFPHFIVMGCFWTLLLPLFYSQIKAQKNELLLYLAIFSALSNVYFSASSTPILTVVAVICFWNIYNVREYGSTIFRAVCLGLLALHLVMKAPVWHLISRIDVFSGSTGWHRYILIDNFVNHISEWFILGTKSTSHWGHLQSDITNQFILEGVRGGMITLVIFAFLVYQSVKIPGRLSLEIEDPEVKWACWGICVVMLGHFTSFWGISYFGQIDMLLYFSFALVGFTLEYDLKINNKAE